MVKYQDEALAKAVKSSATIAEVMRRLGVPYVSGSMFTHIKRRIAALGLDTHHMVSGPSWAKGRPPANRKAASKILVRTQRDRLCARQLRRALIESGVAYRCVACGSHPEWNGRPLVLQVDHIDEDKCNNEMENLRFLCPNCHSQTPNYYRQKKCSQV